MKLACSRIAMLGVLLWAFGQSVGPALGTEAATDPRAGGTVVIGAVGGIAPLNPLITRMTVAANLFDLLFVRLLEETDAGEIAPGLARSWEASADRRTWEFVLRDDVEFHDGVPVTAEDVVFTLELLARQRGAEWALPKMEELAARGPHGLRIRFARAPEPSFLFHLREAILPHHVIGPELEAGRSVDELSFNRTPVGSGPFRFAGWRGDDEVVLAAHDGYFGGRALLDSVVVRAAYESTEEEWAALMRGEIDALVHATSADMASIEADSSFHAVPVAAPSYCTVICNCRVSSLLSDRRLRRAVSLAIDRRAIWRRLGGLSSAPDSAWEICGPLAPGSVWADPEISAPIQDPVAARRLLEEAGWSAEVAGAARQKDGRTLALTLLVQEEFAQMEDVAALLRRDLEQVGIRLRVRSHSYVELASREFLDSEPFDLLSGGGKFGLDPAACTAKWHSRSPSNTGDYSATEMDSLIDGAGRVKDEGRRRRLYRRIHHRLISDMPTLFVCRHPAAIVMRKGIKGGEAVGRRGLFRSLRLIHWQVPREERRKP